METLIFMCAVCSVITILHWHVALEAVGLDSNPAKLNFNLFVFHAALLSLRHATISQSVLLKFLFDFSPLPFLQPKLPSSALASGFVSIASDFQTSPFYNFRL